MSDEAKLGLAAGVLAVVGVAMFGLPREHPPDASATTAVVASPSAGTASNAPGLPPAAVMVPAR
jgi:hypothetical protein